MELYALPTGTAGVWSSSFEVTLQTETFTPGGGDDRALGVRLHRARLELGAGSVPPLKQLLAAGALALFVFLWLAGSRWPDAAFPAALALSVAVGLGYALLRLQTAFSVPVLCVATGLAVGLRWLAPSLVLFFGDAARRGARAAIETFHGITRSTLLAFVVVTAGLMAATAAVPRFEIDLGSGEAEPIAERFGAADGDSGGVRFRHARSNASIDLRDFGWSSPWRIEVRARLPLDSAASGVLARIGGEELIVRLGNVWTSSEIGVPAPSGGWRSGPVIAFPGLEGGRTVDVASVRVDRGRSLPSPRTLVFFLLATGALLAALRASGLPPAIAAGAAGALGLLLALLTGLSPVVVTPFLPTVALGALAGALLAAGARGGLDALAARDLAPELPPAALGVAVTAFVLWFMAAASPLYAGGHFGYHSSVAEEIWQGNFLRYYLPGPDNMLARQPQWGHLIVPHPCLFHTVAAPLAALPSPWFHLTTKLFLAWLLFGIAVVSGLVAGDLGGRRAAATAVVVVALSPIGFQLLGLGHLMTILGCWAAALSLGFLLLQLERLSERRIFLGALALLVLCFLSYTGSLLFASVCLLLTAALLLWTDRHAAVRLGALVALAWACALVLYYGNWVLPFMTESVPRFLEGSSSQGERDLGARLAAEPGKLDYTFGSFLIPLAGLYGVTLARGQKRLLLGAWAGVLVLFSFLDLGFNFLLKHHYFSLPAIAVGLALALDRVSDKNPRVRWVLLLILVLLCWLGLREALSTARGGA